MANHKSAMKRERQNKKRNARNSVFRTQVKGATKKTLTAVEAKDAGHAQETFHLAAITIAKASGKGVIHKRSASRKISQLAKKVNQLKSAVG